MAEIILTGSIVLIFVGFGYLIFDCLMGGKKQKPVKQKAKSEKKENLTYEEKKQERTIKILGNDVPIKRGDGIY